MRAARAARAARLFVLFCGIPLLNPRLNLISFDCGDFVVISGIFLLFGHFKHKTNSGYKHNHKAHLFIVAAVCFMFLINFREYSRDYCFHYVI